MEQLNTYIATAGETWAGISFRLWADEYGMDALIKANPLYARVLVFGGGERLTIPERTDETLTAALPPWRK